MIDVFAEINPQDRIDEIWNAWAKMDGEATLKDIVSARRAVAPHDAPCFRVGAPRRGAEGGREAPTLRDEGAREEAHVGRRGPAPMAAPHEAFVMCRRLGIAGE
jgi:hypothetical protein